MHPLYTAAAHTFGYRPLAGLVGAVATLAAALGVADPVRHSSLEAAAALGPVMVWLGMATYLGQLLAIERRSV